MLDIYNYINSPDVAKHCRKISKLWTPFEMAVLISWSNRNICKRFSFQRFCGKMWAKHKIYVKGEWLIILYYLESVLCGAKAIA